MKLKNVYLHGLDIRDTYRNTRAFQRPHVSRGIGILRLVKPVIVVTCVLFHFYYAFVLPSSRIVLRCGCQLLNVTFSFSSAGCVRRTDFALIRVSCHCLSSCISYKVNSNSNNCLFGKLPSAFTRVLHSPLESKVPRCRTSQFARCFLPAQVRLWNDLRFTLFYAEKLNGFKGAVKPLVAPEFCYF